MPAGPGPAPEPELPIAPGPVPEPDLAPELPADRVLVGYDGSPSALRALHRAAGEAARRETALEVMCCMFWNPPPAPGLLLSPDERRSLGAATREALELALDELRHHHPGLWIEGTVRHQEPAAALIEAGADASLTVVGTRGHGPLLGRLLGSVSLRLAAHSRGPLMIVRGERDRDAEPHGTVLLATKSDSDVAATRFAFEEATRRDAKLRALHAWRFPPVSHHLPLPPLAEARPDPETLRKAADSVPRYAVSRCAEEFPEVAVVTDHECRPTAEALVDASAKADVLVLAVRRRPRRHGLQLGPVTHALVHRAHCPVVLVPVG